MDQPDGEEREQAAARARGRPRDPWIAEAVLAATLRHLATDGYGRMSVEAIAAEAGVGKPTVYRRWPTKAHLAAAALAALREREPIPDTGSPRGDLIAVLGNFRHSLLRPNGLATIGTVLVEECRTPELLAVFRERMVRPRRRILGEILDAARDAGELRPDADLDAAVSLLVGSFYAQYLTGDGIADDWPERIVGVIWDGLAAAQ